MDMNGSSSFAANVGGRRIFDVNYLIHQVKKVSKHGSNNCGWMEVDLVREVQNGLRSSFEFKCRECHMVFELKTDENLQKDFNLEMISAATQANVEFASLDAILKAGEIPFLPNSAYGTVKSTTTGSNTSCVGDCGIMKDSHLQAHGYPAHDGDPNSVLTYDSTEEHDSSEPTELMDITHSKNLESKKDGNGTHSCGCTSNNKRVKSRNAYSVRCLFCGKVILHRSLLIHFIRKHKDKEEVKKILNLQKNNPWRTMLLRNLKPPFEKEAPLEAVARTTHDSTPVVPRTATTQTVSTSPATSVSQNIPFRSNLLSSVSEHGHPTHSTSATIPTEHRVPTVDEVYNQPTNDFVSVPYPFSTHRTITSNPSLHTFDSALSYNSQKQHYPPNGRENPNQMHHPALISTMPYAAAVNESPYYSPAQCDNEAQRNCMDFFGFQSGMQNRWPVQSFSSDLSMPSKAHASSHKRISALDDLPTTHHFSLHKPIIEPRKQSRSKSPSSKIKRNTWTPEERQCLLEFFGPDIFLDQKLPSYYTCEKAIEKYNCLHLRTKAQVKAFINNEQRKWKKRLGLNVQDSTLCKDLNHTVQEPQSSTAMNLHA